MPGNPSARRPHQYVLLAAVAVGAVVLLVVTGAFAWHPTRSAAAAEQQARAEAFEAGPGSCLSWRQPNEQRISKVDCAKPHLFETIAHVELPTGDKPPAAHVVQDLSARRCTAKAADYLGKPLDPEGKYTIGALAPNKEQWSDGQRTLVCGLRAAAPSGKRLFEQTGSVRDADQSNVFPDGTCIAMTENGAPGDPVDCGQEHAYEIVGTVDEQQLFGDQYPDAQRQRHSLVDKCTALAKQYTSLDYTKFGLQLTWDTRGEQSWKAGSRKVNCKVAAAKPDGSGLRTTTGSIKR